MPILTTIERRSVKGKALVLTIYSLLVAGAVSMVYPFSLMIAGATKSAVDTPEAKVVPAYLTSESALWAKYCEGLFNESLGEMRQTMGVDVPAFRFLTPPKHRNPQLVEEWEAFLESGLVPDYAYTLGHLSTPNSRTTPLVLRELKADLLQQYGPKIDVTNEALGSEFAGWSSFNVQPHLYLLRRHRWINDPLAQTQRDFSAKQPSRYRYCAHIEGFYVRNYLRGQYGRKVSGYNDAHGTAHSSYDDVHLSRNAPPVDQQQRRKNWSTFIRVILHPFWISIDGAALDEYQAYLKAKYASDITALNRLYRTKHTRFEQLSLPNDLRAVPGVVSSDLDTFLQGWEDPETAEKYEAPLEALSIDSVGFRFSDWLMDKHGSIGNINAELGTSFGSEAEIQPPQREFFYKQMFERAGHWRWEFTARNFMAVTDYIVLRGRGVLNTAIYCFLAVLAALIVNPMAAYALSRNPPPSSYKILLLLMLTMAFPPMVTQIPVFLMLRDFKLLNTFAALILPGLANGYSIFLLKGFFDSLPKELYESASIDGAGEFRIFWQITMSLSKPILAVIALNAFTMAYSNFMMALLICQDKKMWTLMVWMYQLQQSSGQGVIFASLLIAAIPTFLVFAFCQNIIMRGIVVPVEK